MVKLAAVATLLASLLASLIASADAASVRRAFLNGEASQVKVDYECPGHSECPEAGLPCDFADGALLSNQFLGDKQVRFEGPGFGNPNGGVWLGGCSVADGDYPPLSNASVNGNGFMGFSTLHTLSGRVGKPVGPETIRFDAYMTNVAVGFAGLDGHPVEIEVYSGAADSYDDLGELLLKESVPLSDGLVRHELVDSQNIFVDCVRRLVISSTAKIFLLDDLEYGPSATDCATRAAEAAAAKAEADAAAAGETVALGQSGAGDVRPASALAVSFAAAAAALVAGRRGVRRR